ncbi:MAG: response regulator [Cyanobacteria bacterium J06629_9]
MVHAPQRSDRPQIFLRTAAVCQPIPTEPHFTPPHLTPYVLLLEASTDLQCIVQIGLSLVAGLKVVAMSPEQDWMSVIQQRAPTLILVDVSNDGYDLITQLQAVDQVPKIPIVCMVDRDRTYDQIQAKQRGIAAIIAKPFDMMVLANIVKDVLEQSRN